MSIRRRIILSFILLVGVGFYIVADQLMKDVRRRYLEAMEETMVDVATILAASVSVDSAGWDEPIPAQLDSVFSVAKTRTFEAKIYDLTKTKMDMDVYVTDAKGIVLYDSTGIAEGQDFSGWNDVMKTLDGRYGARSTRIKPDDPTSSVLHIASPIYINGEIAGVLSVIKPAKSHVLFMNVAQQNIAVTGFAVALIVVLMTILVSGWVTRPIDRLTHYIRALGEGKEPPRPKLPSRDLSELGDAFEALRAELVGKEYVESYVQTLTHEMKSPLAAIRGAAELMDEADMPHADRQRFLNNVLNETARMQDLVDRMLALTVLESRQGLEDVEAIDLKTLIDDVVNALDAVARTRELTLRIAIQAEALVVKGERFLLNQALTNLVQNAIDFSASGEQITVRLTREAGSAIIAVSDSGDGIPDYARERVFDRFYSLPRPASGRKSTGLGLPFVRQVARLHRGEATVSNRPEGGTIATIRLPMTKHN